MAPSPPPELNPDIIDEVLVRLPRDDPAGFIRASVVCKSWLATLTDLAFLRRYRDLHGTAPLVLGFLHNPVNRSHARFVPTTPFRPPAVTDHSTTVVLDCRHGRALFYDYGSAEFVVWDPITGRERRMPDNVLDTCSNHAVLCAAGAFCDHSACNEGPFVIASAGVECYEYESVQADACFVSSETGVPDGPDGLYLDSKRYRLEEGRAAVLVGGTLYFVCGNAALLRYDVLGTHDLSVIEPPPGKFRGSRTIVTRAENGGLGLATLRRDVLQLWSAETGPDGDVKWAKMNRIHLRELTPFKSPSCLIGFAEDINVVFVRSNDHVIFTIELKSLLMKKLCEMDEVDDVFPYVCNNFDPKGCITNVPPAISM